MAAKHWYSMITKSPTSLRLGLAATVVILMSAVPEVAAKSTLLFKSNFGAGVTLGPPRDFSSRSCWQDIVGTDSETGYSWPIVALGADRPGAFSGIQIISSNYSLTPSILNDYAENTIVRVTGPEGTPVNALFQNVKQKEPAGRGGAQSPLIITRPWTIGDTGDLYITYWFKHQANVAELLDAAIPNAQWRVQFEFKTGGYDNKGGAGDYRIATSITKGTDGKLFWRTKGDNVANANIPPVTYWVEDNTTVAVPVGEWFKYEVFIHRSNGPDGRFWSAVNGVTFIDRRGPNMGEFNLPITRLMINNPYSGGHAPVQSLTTGLEIWDDFPPSGVTRAISPRR